MATRSPLVYADSSALVKIVLEEPETAALAAYLAATQPQLASSAIARVEMLRTIELAEAPPSTRAAADDLLDACMLIDVSDSVLRAAVSISPPRLRALDALHLATAIELRPDVLLAYDARLLAGARGLGLAVVSPS